MQAEVTIKEEAEEDVAGDVTYIWEAIVPNNGEKCPGKTSRKCMRVDRNPQSREITPSSPKVAVPIMPLAVAAEA